MADNEKITGITMVVRRNQVHDPQREGGILTLHAPEAELKRIMAEEPLFAGLEERGLMAAELHLVFAADAPMLAFPAGGDELVTQGFRVVLDRLPPFTLEDRQALGLRTAAERVAAARAANDSIAAPAASQ